MPRKAAAITAGDTGPRARARAIEFARALQEHYPDAHCELKFRSPHELLVATILSAQTTDAGVNKVTGALFDRFPTPEAFAAATPGQIEPFIRSIGLFRAKARSIHESMTALVRDFGGKVPATMDELLTLRGVARKTANVVLGNAFNINVGFVVDTHIDRLSKRFGLVRADANVRQIEIALMELFPQDQWCILSHRIIWHGRRACKARGARCENHPICARFGPCGPDAARGAVCEGCHSLTSITTSAKRKQPSGKRPPGNSSVAKSTQSSPPASTAQRPRNRLEKPDGSGSLRSGSRRRKSG